MRRIMLKDMSPEKQLPLFLPLLSLLVLLVAVLTVSRLRSGEAVETDGEWENSVSTTATEGEPVNLLLLWREPPAVYMAAARFDPAAGRIAVSALPASMSVDGMSAEKRYERIGAAGLRGKLSQTLGVSLDYYMDFSAAGLRQLLQYYGGGVAVRLTEPVAHTDVSGLSVSFPAGQVKLSANQAAELLELTAAVQKPARFAAIVQGIFSGYIQPQRAFERDYTALTAAADTDMHIYDFKRHQTALERMAAAAPQCVLLDALPTAYDANDLAKWRRNFGG